MKKMIFLGLAAATVVAGATPAAAQYRDRGGYDRYDDRYDRYDRYNRGYTNQRRGRAYSATDRDGDGFDDRDLNFDHYIDAREHRRAGTGTVSATDRNGDGFDDRDINGDGWISPREEQIPVRATRRFRGR